MGTTTATLKALRHLPVGKMWFINSDKGFHIMCAICFKVLLSMPSGSGAFLKRRDSKHFFVYIGLVGSV